jgi:hypothetical protein
MSIAVFGDTAEARQSVSIAEMCIFHQVIETQTHCLLCSIESLLFKCSG